MLITYIKNIKVDPNQSVAGILLVRLKSFCVIYGQSPISLVTPL